MQVQNVLMMQRCYDMMELRVMVISKLLCWEKSFTKQYGVTPNGISTMDYSRVLAYLDSRNVPCVDLSDLTFPTTKALEKRAEEFLKSENVYGYAQCIAPATKVSKDTPVVYFGATRSRERGEYSKNENHKECFGRTGKPA